MALKKQNVVDLIEVLENGTVQVRTAIKIIENNEIISQSYHRHVILPGQDYSSEDNKVQAVCSVIQTADVVTAFNSVV